VKNWAKASGWTVFELEHAAKAGNWDVVTKKLSSRKRNWDLGIQKTAFLGMAGDAAVKGLLNQSLSPNTTLIKKKISLMTTEELKTFVSSVMDAYRTNCLRSA